MTNDISSDPIRERCPTCHGNRVCQVHGHIYVPWHWKDSHGLRSASGGIHHSLLQCRGCETVFYLSDSWNDEDLDQWVDRKGNTKFGLIRRKTTFPTSDSAQRPIWLDEILEVDPQLHRILEEVYVAQDNHAFILAAMGLRTAIDRGTAVLEIDDTWSFKKKLQALAADGWIGSDEHDIIEKIINAGSAAAHRGWAPDAKKIAQLLRATESFVQRAFIISRDASEMGNNIPEKPKGGNAKLAKKPE